MYVCMYVYVHRPLFIGDMRFSTHLLNRKQNCLPCKYFFLAQASVYRRYALEYPTPV